MTIQFGGDGDAPNLLPITPGWNFMVRLYRPWPDIVDGRWTFPEAAAVWRPHEDGRTREGPAVPVNSDDRWA